MTSASRSSRKSLISADRPFFTSEDRLDLNLALRSANFAHGELSVGRYRRDLPNHGVLTANPLSPIFMVVVTLRPLPRRVMQKDGRYIDLAAVGIGTVACFDLRQSWTSDAFYPFDSFHIYIPPSAFDEVTTEMKLPKIERLSCGIELGQHDIVMLRLAQAILPMMMRPGEVTSLAADHIFLAIVAHLAATYGGFRSEALKPETRRRGTLTPLQERRVTDRLLGDLKVDTGLLELAALCGLSRSHFARAFRQTTGLPPHRWLLMQRVRQAKALLQATTLPLAEIALECGFADQSHLTRVFSRWVGLSPGAWRRQRQT